VTLDDREDTQRREPQCGDEGAAEKPWRSCECAIESDARDGLGLLNVCAILN
jgi:hypothetical protein